MKMVTGILIMAVLCFTSSAVFAGQRYSQQQNYQSSDQDLHPDMEKRVYPPGYPIPVRGGQISYPQPDGSVIVYSPPSGGDVYNQQGQKVGTYKPR